MGHGQISGYEPSVSSVRNEKQVAKLQPLNSTKTPRADKERFNSSVGYETTDPVIGDRQETKINNKEGQEEISGNMPSVPLQKQPTKLAQ